MTKYDDVDLAGLYAGGNKVVIIHYPILSTTVSENQRKLVSKLDERDAKQGFYYMALVGAIDYMPGPIGPFDSQHDAIEHAKQYYDWRGD